MPRLSQAQLFALITCGVCLALGFGLGSCEPTRVRPDLGGEPIGIAVSDGAAPSEAVPGGAPVGCVGLACDQWSCGSGVRTRLRGRVMAPNGIDPVPGALVYVPLANEPFSSHVSCEACEDAVTGHALVLATAGVDGRFVLDNVPVSSSVPITIQKGRFRKTTDVPIEPCRDNLLDGAAARLPRNQSEGELPRIAVGVGDYDQVECVLRAMGIDESEFTDPAGQGAVHLYPNGGSLAGQGDTPFTRLLAVPGRLFDYNLLFINCTANFFGDLPNSSANAAAANLRDYVGAGGRLYVTDFSYDYLEQVPEFAPYIAFSGGGDLVHPQPLGAAQLGRDAHDIIAHVLDSSLATWLGDAMGAPRTEVTITNLLPGFALVDATASDTLHYPTTTWVGGETNGGNRPLTVSFDYNQCGKVLYSSYHAREPGGTNAFGPAPVFPSYCVSQVGDMLEQERILMYLLFEVSACIVPLQ